MLEYVRFTVKRPHRPPDLQFDLLYEDVSRVLFDSRCIINCQTLRQALAAYLVHRVKTQNIERAGHWTEHFKHLKHKQQDTSEETSETPTSKKQHGESLLGRSPWPTPADQTWRGWCPRSELACLSVTGWQLETQKDGADVILHPTSSETGQSWSDPRRELVHIYQAAGWYWRLLPQAAVLHLLAATHTPPPLRAAPKDEHNDISFITTDVQHGPTASHCTKVRTKHPGNPSWWWRRWTGLSCQSPNNK